MASLEKHPIEFRNFGGGITDDVVDCEDTQYQKAENLLLDFQDKFLSRPGSILYDVSNPRPISERTSHLYNYYNDTNLFNFSGSRGFYYNAGWTELLGPTSQIAFPSANGFSRFNVSEWKRHMFVTNDAGDLPVVIYPNATSTGFTLRTAGLPAIASNKNFDETATTTTAITLANQLKSQMLAHFAYTTSSYHRGPHAAAINGLTAPDATNLATLLTLVSNLQTVFTMHAVSDALNGNPLYHIQTLSNAYEQYYTYKFSLNTLNPPTTLLEACSILVDMKIKWNEHDALSPVYFDGSKSTSFHNSLGNLFLVTAPSIDLTLLTRGPSIVKNFDLINSVAVQLNSLLRTHIVDAARHTAAGTMVTEIDTAHGSSLTTPTSLPLLIDYVNDIIRLYSLHQDDRISFNSATTGAHPSTPTAAHKLAGYGTVTTNKNPYYPCLLRDDSTYSEVVTALADLQSKFALHYNNSTYHNGGAVTALYQATTLTVGGFIYALHYVYTYTIDGTTFEVDGPVTQIELDDTLIPAQQPQTIINIPTLTNTTYTNYDTVNLKINVFRTQINLKTFYLVAQISNGTVTYADATGDDELTDTATIYTNGGVVESTPPPIAKYVHTIADTTYYANIVDAGQSLPQTIRQAVPGSPEASPGSFTVDLLEPVVGLSSFRQIPVVFTGSNVYRLEQSFDQLGRGSIRAVAISDKGGCKSSGTITQTTEGIFFAGIDGYYKTDGYKVECISKELRITYASLYARESQRQRSFGVYDRILQNVWFSTASNSDENDSFYVADLESGVLGDKAFTTVVNGSYFRPTAACFFRGQLIRGDRLGYVFKHDYSYTSDPRIDSTAAASTWGVVPIVWDHISRAVDYGTIYRRKIATDFSLKTRNVGNVSIQVKSIDDLGARIKDFTAIRYRPNCVWGDPTIVWGNSTTIWNPAGEDLEKRKFPANSLRFTQKQIQIKTGFVVIQNSDSTVQATVDSAAKTVTLIAPGSFTWQGDLIDQFIYFSLDSYATSYQITAVTSTVLTLSTAPASGSYKWVVKGFPKNERLNLLSYQMIAGMGGPSIKDPYNESGANA